ncbi:T9SS type A sorting domain-containing protein [Chryseobacterium sp. RLHN22]|uniref:T9SS type A sorting domain-containing protein n=1 Tax=Chryseobacterium sp. RLHN22 TaxID=3437885 RepID=UPI003D9BEFA2
MKKILLSLALTSAFFGNAQTLISENFEGATFPPNGWTISSTVSSRPWQLTNSFPTSTSGFLISGTKSAGVDYIAQSNTANLVSPSFTLVGASNPVLKFKVKVGWSYMIDDDYGDLLAQISTDGGSTWVTLWDEDTEPGFTDDGDGNPDTDLYNTVSVEKSLSTYIGQSNVKIRFSYVADDADAISIDDIEVLAANLSTSEVSKSKTSVFPNPTKGEINIKTDKKIKSTSVLDLSGKVISRGNSEKVNLNSVTKGTYLLQIEFTDGSTKTEKIIKD